MCSSQTNKLTNQLSLLPSNKPRPYHDVPVNGNYTPSLATHFVQKSQKEGRQMPIPAVLLKKWDVSCRLTEIEFDVYTFAEVGASISTLDVACNPPCGRTIASREMETLHDAVGSGSDDSITYSLAKCRQCLFVCVRVRSAVSALESSTLLLGSSGFC
jgi:hypothetical protein